MATCTCGLPPGWSRSRRLHSMTANGMPLTNNTRSSRRVVLEWRHSTANSAVTWKTLRSQCALAFALHALVQAGAQGQQVVDDLIGMDQPIEGHIEQPPLCLIEAVGRKGLDRPPGLEAVVRFEPGP